MLSASSKHPNTLPRSHLYHSSVQTQRSYLHRAPPAKPVVSIFQGSACRFPDVTGPSNHTISQVTFPHFSWAPSHLAWTPSALRTEMEQLFIPVAWFNKATLGRNLTSEIPTLMRDWCKPAQSVPQGDPV